MKKVKFRDCPQCKQVITKSKKVCPVCRYRIYGAEPEHRDLDKKVVSMLDTGNYTLQVVGDVVGLTRERVRQIYVRETGKPYGKRFFVKRAEIRKQKREELLKKVKFNCIGCKKPVTKGEAVHRSLYCLDCFKIYKIDKRDPKTTIICSNCGINFHPLRNWKYLKARPLFHSIKCYLDFMKKNNLSTYTIKKYLEQNTK